jgi:hypothetical protein
MNNEELAIEFERRNPYECFVSCVEMGIESIIEELDRIKAGEPPTPEQQKDIDACSSQGPLTP